MVSLLQASGSNKDVRSKTVTFTHEDVGATYTDLFQLPEGVLLKNVYLNVDTASTGTMTIRIKGSTPVNLINGQSITSTNVVAVSAISSTVPRQISSTSTVIEVATSAAITAGEFTARLEYLDVTNDGTSTN